MKLILWAFLAALGQADIGTVFLSSGKYFGDVRDSLSSLDVADAVARTFYLGYLNPDAQTDYLKIPLDMPSQNLLLSVAGLDGVDLSLLTNLQGLGVKAPLGRSPQDPLAGFSALKELAAENGARVVGLMDAPTSPASADAFLASEYWSPLVSNEILSRPGMLELVQELDVLRTASFAPSTMKMPTLYFGNLRSMTGINAADKTDAARIVDNVLGQILGSLPGALVQIVAVKDVLESARYKEITAFGPEAIRQGVARKLLQVPTPTPTTASPTQAPTKTITIEEVAVKQFKYWTIIILAIVAYSAIYYIAFYGDYSADQMLYTSFNARWDERKRD